MALTITTPAGVQRIPPVAAASGPALSDATPAALGTAAAGVSTEASRADHVHAGPAGIDTSLQLAPDTGWTAAGNGSAAIASGVATLINQPWTTSARVHRPLPLSSPHAPLIEVVCRCTLVTANGLMGQGIGITNSTFTRGVYAFIDGSNYWGRYNVAGSWVNGAYTNSGGTANWYAGTVWLRVVFGPTHAHCYYGIGAGSTPPTSWTRIDSFPLGSSSPNFSEALGLGLTDLVVFTTRAGGLAADECTAQNIQWRSLLGAPT